MLEYINLVYWFIALAGLIAWARVSASMCEDIERNMVHQPDLLWKLGSAGVFLLMLIIFITMPSFWVALPLNLLLAGGMFGGYMAVRSKTIGNKGTLLGSAIDMVNTTSQKIESRKNARQVQLTYLRHDNVPMPLPPPNDPLAAGLGTADQIVIQALMRRSEIVDLAPASNGYTLTMTTDGVASPPAPMDRTAAESAVQALKVLSGLSAEERRRPQTGNFRSRDAEGTTTTWTVRTSGSVAGERVLLSANEKGQWDLPLDQLGMTAEQLAEAKKLGADTQGVVLVSAPRGHGRTATLYALLRQHDAFTNSVQTVEVNPQTEIEGVTVNRFDNRVGPDVSFSKLVQSVMLKDPNVLLVAQVPDGATADLITKYANADSAENHRVLAALVAQDSFATIENWLALNSNKQAALNSLRVIIAQRLVRILCPTCKIPYQPDEATMKRLNIPMGRNLQSFKANTEPIVDRKGNSITCPDCGGIGYKGRTGIFEVLVVTDEMKKTLAAGGGINQVRALARRNNMLLLPEHGIRKFANGLTAIHEVTRVLTPAGNPGGSAAGKTSIVKPQ